VFNAWFPAGGTILEGGRNFERWGLARGSGCEFEGNILLLPVALYFLSTVR
jgi:hypothetical protein